jgi:hypothetical protein
MVDHDKQPNPHQQDWNYNHDWVMEAITTALSALTGLAFFAWVAVLSWVN